MAAFAYLPPMLEDLPDYAAVLSIQRALWHVSDVRGAAVMVGSGFSLNAELPTPSSRRPPLWREMAEAMERQLGTPSPGGLNALRLAEQYRALLGQPALEGLIRDFVPDEQWLPGAAHRRLVDLPWSDVLTTNWDTLIERAANELTERQYDVVRTPADIARTRSPRIVKLHGSLPSHTPFILTEEDFRTYPVQFAPFVNLAQHVLLENELLLLGFSGDDPNFLAWAGWVRDQLGSGARKIRLAGVLELTPAHRRYLENLNVTPIDLTPLVDDIADPAQRHSRATTLLLDSLHSARPQPIQVWNRTPRGTEEAWDSARAGERLEGLIENWIADRAAAPDWFVAPFVERYHLRMEIESAVKSALRHLETLDAAPRGRFAAELAWRLDTAHYGTPEWARNLFEFALRDPGAALAPAERVRILKLVAYQAIEDRDDAAFEGYSGDLDAVDSPDASAWSAYLRALRARDRFDLTAVAAELTQICGDDPAWLLRRASLHCLLCEPKKAARLVRTALLTIKRKRALDRRSLWLLSREAWARFLWRQLSFELRDEEDAELDIGDDWPAQYGELRTDPWDELNTLETQLRDERKSAGKYAAAEKAHFEPGSWTPRSEEQTRYVSSWVVPVEWQLRRLADAVGLPLAAGHAIVMEARLVRAVEGHEECADASQIWRVATYVRSYDGELIDRWFGRLQVAAMPRELADDLIARLRDAIGFFGETLRDPAGDDFVDRVSRTRTLMELLSRLAVRADPEAAGAITDLAISVFARGGERHWWMYLATAHLISRALSAIPPTERGAHAGKMLAFPLPAERKVDGFEDEWPEFSRAFEPAEVLVERPAGDWDGRIAELIAWVAKDRHASRHNAILRLWLLAKKQLLTPDETRRFGDALWSWRTSPDGLPNDHRFYPAIFLELPEPSPGMAAAAFDHDIVQPLLAGDLSRAPLGLQSLAYAGFAAEKKTIERPFSAETALDLLRALPRPDGKDSDDEQCDAIFYGLLPAATLDNTVSADLWQRATAPHAVGALQFLPVLALRDPALAGAAVTHLQRAMNSRDFNTVNSALSAVRFWARKVDPGGFPPALGAAVSSLIALRRDPGLFRAIDCCVDLVERDLLDDDELGRVLDGLSDLLVETHYQDWPRSNFRPATLTYVRANAFRLARALKRKGRSDAAVQAWIEAGACDAVPEVRYVADEHE